MAFFATADLKIFSWCNVIQQIKKPSPYTEIYQMYGDFY